MVINFEQIFKSKENCYCFECGYLYIFFFLLHFYKDNLQKLGQVLSNLTLILISFLAMPFFFA